MNTRNRILASLQLERMRYEEYKNDRASHTMTLEESVVKAHYSRIERLEQQLQANTVTCDRCHWPTDREESLNSGDVIICPDCHAGFVA